MCPVSFLSYLCHPFYHGSAKQPILSLHPSGFSGRCLALPQPSLFALAGDYSDAIETLLTAIAVIKQSRVANDERCRVLISSLKDCLHGIEAKSYSVGASSSSSR